MGDISGYRALTKEELDLINRIKAMGEEVCRLVDEVERDALVEGDRSDPAHLSPVRSARAARTELQTGFMWLVRAVARPQSF